MVATSETVGERIHRLVLEGATLNGIPFGLNRYGDGVFANGIRVIYDPADCWDENAPSEFVYIRRVKGDQNKRSGDIIGEGIVNGLADGIGAVYRIGGLDGPEILLPTPETLVGYLLALLVELTKR